MDRLEWKQITRRNQSVWVDLQSGECLRIILTDYPEVVGFDAKLRYLKHLLSTLRAEREDDDVIVLPVPQKYKMKDRPGPAEALRGMSFIDSPTTFLQTGQCPHPFEDALRLHALSLVPKFLKS